MLINQHNCCVYNDSLVEKLEKYGIKYKITCFDDPKQESLLSFYLETQSPFYEEIMSLCMSNITFRDRVFSQKEIETAKWLDFHCSNLSVDLVKEEESFCFEEPLAPTMVNHKRLKSDPTFFLSKPIKWSNRKHFAASYSMGAYYLFCDKKVKDLFETLQAKIMFKEVYSTKGSLLSDTYFMIINDVLSEEDVCFLGEERKIVCPICEKKQYELSSDYQLHVSQKGLLEKSFICRTPSFFGAGCLTYPINLISHDLYLLLKKDKLIQNMIYTPIVME